MGHLESKLEMTTSHISRPALAVWASVGPTALPYWFVDCYVAFALKAMLVNVCGLKISMVQARK